MTSGIPAYVYLRLMDRWQLGSASNCKRRRNREQRVKIEPDVIYPVGSPQTLRVVYASLGFRTLVPDVRMKRNPPLADFVVYLISATTTLYIARNCTKIAHCNRCGLKGSGSRVNRCAILPFRVISLVNVTGKSTFEP